MVTDIPVHLNISEILWRIQPDIHVNHVLVSVGMNSYNLDILKVWRINRYKLLGISRVQINGPQLTPTFRHRQLWNSNKINGLDHMQRVSNLLSHTV
jgi:hypothetical protein